MKDMKAKKEKSDAAHIASVILAIAGILSATASIVLYHQYGINIYSNSYRNQMFICLGCGMAFLLISLFIDRLPVMWSAELVKPMRIVAYLLFLYGLLQFMYTSATLIGAVYVGIDTEQYGPLIPGFVFTCSVVFVSIITSLLSAVFYRRRERDESSCQNNGTEE